MRVILEHKRIGHEYDGRFVLDDNKDEVNTVLLTFSRKDYKSIICELSIFLKKYPQALAVITRTDRPGLLPISLDHEATDLIRNDPVAAIRSMHVEPLRINVRPKVVESPLLRVGYDSMSDSFGDYVYIRRRSTRVESPFTGRWEEVHWSYIGLPILPGFGLMFEIEEVNDRWMRIKTPNLLILPADMPEESANYFIPRAWNVSGPWINHEDLNKKYDEFQQERDECSKVLETN